MTEFKLHLTLHLQGGRLIFPLLRPRCLAIGTLTYENVF
jgi:hypothetical protein